MILAERDDDVSDVGRGANLGFADGHREEAAIDARSGAVVDDAFVDVDVGSRDCAISAVS